jgi:hypothetical protein
VSKKPIINPNLRPGHPRDKDSSGRYREATGEAHYYHFRAASLTRSLTASADSPAPDTVMPMTRTGARTAEHLLGALLLFMSCLEEESSRKPSFRQSGVLGN